MALAERISEVCKKQHDIKGAVLPPQVCPYCFGCPLAAIVTGVTGHNGQRGAISIPVEYRAEIEQWLDKLERKLEGGA